VFFQGRPGWEEVRRRRGARGRFNRQEDLTLREEEVGIYYLVLGGRFGVKTFAVKLKTVGQKESPQKGSSSQPKTAGDENGEGL